MLVSGVLLFDLDTGFLRYQKKFAPRFGLATSSSLDPVRVCLQLLVFQQFADFHLRSFGNVTMKRINGLCAAACVVIGPVAEVREQVAEKLKLALGEDDDVHIGSASTSCSTTATATGTSKTKTSKKVLGEKVKTAVVEVHLEQIFREELTKNPILRYMAFCFKTSTSAALARSTTDTGTTATTADASATARSGSATEQTPWASDARRRERAASAANNPAFIGQGIVPGSLDDGGGGGASGAVHTPQSNTTRRRLWRWVPCFPSRPRSRSGVLGGASATPTPTATPATATAARARANTAGPGLWNKNASGTDRSDDDTAACARGEQLQGSGAEGGLVVFLLSRGSGDGGKRAGNAPAAPAEEEVDVDEITLDVIRKKVLDNCNAQDEEAESDEITRTKMKVTRSCTTSVGAGAEDVVILSSHDPDLSDEDWTTLKTCTQYLTEIKAGRLYPHGNDEDEWSASWCSPRVKRLFCSQGKSCRYLGFFRRLLLFYSLWLCFCGP